MIVSLCLFVVCWIVCGDSDGFDSGDVLRNGLVIIVLGVQTGGEPKGSSMKEFIELAIEKYLALIEKRKKPKKIRKKSPERKERKAV